MLLKDTPVFCYNNISNAIKSIGQNGQIVLTSTMNATFVEITVEDNGLGIPDENIGKLFRVDTTITIRGIANESGTELGSILCKELIE